MRENCTYGSMRGRAFPTGRPALLYTLGVPAGRHPAGRAGLGLSGDKRVPPGHRIVGKPSDGI